MEKFTQLSGIAAPMPMPNIDTDKIFPAVYLKTIKRTGLSKWLFQEVRFRADGSENPDFVLNRNPIGVLRSSSRVTISAAARAASTRPGP